MEQKYKWQPQEAEDDDEAMTELPPQLLEGNILIPQNKFQPRDAMVVRIKDKHTMVLFPSASKVEVLERSLKCTEDKRPQTLEALNKIKEKAMDQAKRQAGIKKDISNLFAASVKQQQKKTCGKIKNNSSEKRKCLPDIMGYLDTYDWDRHHNQDPSLTFSRTRHYQRMTTLAEMTEFSAASPLEDINIPMKMDEYELFDKTRASEDISIPMQIN